MTSQQPIRPLLPTSRKVEMTKFLDQVGQATVATLAEKFHVSRDTVRRDLEDLDAEGIILREHGGAISNKYQASSEFSIPQRFGESDAGKARIGKAAAELVTDGMALLINGGTTVLNIAAHLKTYRNLIVVTNNLLLPNLLSDMPMREMYMLGGAIRPLSQVTLGPVAFPSVGDKASHKFVADLALIGVGGVSVGNGLSTSNVSESQMIRGFMDVSTRVAVLVDSTKIGKACFAQIAPLSSIDFLITDAPVPSDIGRYLTENGVTLIEA